MMLDKIKMYHIAQTFNRNKIDNIPAFISEEFNKINLTRKITPDMKIGITVGSRGINNFIVILKSIIDEVKKRKGIPFIIPAMGSHGDACNEGQRKILAGYGITEDSMEVPIQATMDVIQLAKSGNGLPVYFDKCAFEADGIIVVNRIKEHTVYKSEIESGLCKMLSVGLGNHQGATMVHILGPKSIAENVLKFAQIILEKTPILCGLGIVEDAYDNTSKIKVVNPEDFIKTDKELLIECKVNSPSLPVPNVDILILAEMGKNISGAGMDTNIVGGVKAYKIGEYKPPQIRKIVVLDLTSESHGNALGVGIPDIITQRLYKKIDFKITYKNVITCGYLDRVKIPLVANTDKEAIKIALGASYNLPGVKPSIIIVGNTLKLYDMFVSEIIWEKIKNQKNISTTSKWNKLTFDNIGNLTLRI